MSSRVCFDLEARMALKRGFDRVANIAQVTLGPIGGVVALERIAGRDKAPELISDTGTIARRLVELPGRFENMGSMLARHVAWRIHEEVGDGCATGLVIAQSIIADAVRYVAAGHNAMSLWRGIKRCQPYVEAYLNEMVQSLEEPEQIVGLADSVLNDEQLARFIEEIFDIIGPQGFVEVRSAYGMESDREYVEGVYWDAGWVSPYFADKDIGTQATVQKPYVLVTDQRLESAPDLVPVLERVRRDGGKALVVIAADISSSALNLMVSNNAKGTLRLLGLKAPRYGDMRLGVLEDICISCGARFVRKDAGDQISSVTVEDLGHAQTVVCNRATFTLIGTMGRPQAIRERIHTLRATRENADEKEDRKNLDERIGKLLGGTALLHVSGQSKEDRDRRKDVAETAVQVVRLGLQGGIVPGGGTAYVAAARVLDDVPLSDDEAPARDILRRALLMPLRRLAQNAGHDPGPIVAHAEEGPNGWGFDVVHGQYVDMMSANIVDPLPTVLASFTHGLSAASMALTTNALVYRSDKDKTPSFEP